MNKEKETWTVISALNRVLDLAQDCKLSDEFWTTCKAPLAYLRQKLGLTNMQIILLAIMAELGDVVSWKRLGNYLGCSRLTIMLYSEEIEDLLAKRWCVRKAVHELFFHVL